MHASGSDFRLYDGSDLKTYLLMRWQGPDALAVCQAHQALPSGFLLLSSYDHVQTVSSPNHTFFLIISKWKRELVALL